MVLMVSVSAARAAVVMPSAYADTPGNTGFLFSMSTSITTQNLFKPADMTGLNVLDQIIGFRLRGNGAGVGYPPPGVTQPQTWPRFDIAMGVGPTDLSTTLANNFVGPPMQVRTGALAMGLGFFPGTGTPRDWSQLIAFDTPYTYTGGNLALQVRSTTSGVGYLIDATGGLGIPSGKTTGEWVVGIGSNPTMSNAAGVINGNWIVQFETIPAPEPSSLSLLALGAGIALSRQRGRARGA
jgi:hypothetical protein